MPPLPTKTARRTYSFAPSTLERLDALAAKKGVKDGVIIRDALALYDHIERARERAAENGQPFTVLLDRGDNHPSELIIPG